MPASVLIVHNDLAFVAVATATLRGAGHDVASFTDPIVALDALEAARRAEVLITRVLFPKGKPNGVSLALVAQSKRPGLRVIFVARADQERHAKGVGDLFMPMPVDLPKLVEEVTHLVQLSRQGVL